MTRFLPAIVAMAALAVLGCGSKADPGTAAKSEPTVERGDGYTMTKKPVTGDMVPVYPDPTDPKAKTPPKQQSYDTPYSGQGSNRPPAGVLEPIEAMPAEKATSPKAVEPGG